MKSSKSLKWLHNNTLGGLSGHLKLSGFEFKGRDRYWIPESRCTVEKGSPQERHLLRFFEQTSKVEAGGHPSVRGGMQVEGGGG